MKLFLAPNVFKDLFAGIRDLVGGRSATYERELQNALRNSPGRAAAKSARFRGQCRYRCGYRL